MVLRGGSGKTGAEPQLSLKEARADGYGHMQQSENPFSEPQCRVVCEVGGTTWTAPDPLIYRESPRPQLRVLRAQPAANASPSRLRVQGHISHGQPGKPCWSCRWRWGWVFYSHLSTSLVSKLRQFGLSMEKNFLSIELVFPDTILCPPMG